MIACERAIAFVLERSMDHRNLNDPPLPLAIKRLNRDLCKWHSVELRVYISYLIGIQPLGSDAASPQPLSIRTQCKTVGDPAAFVGFSECPNAAQICLGNWAILDDRICVRLPWHQHQMSMLSNLFSSKAYVVFHRSKIRAPRLQPWFCGRIRGCQYLSL
jgi:hypothetical protein